MSGRKDCPINMDGLSSHDRAWVMKCRRDYPINLDGLFEKEKMEVLAVRNSEEDLRMARNILKEAGAHEKMG